MGSEEESMTYILRCFRSCKFCAAMLAVTPKGELIEFPLKFGWCFDSC